MARGWESKAVEAQIETEQSERSGPIRERLSSRKVELIRKKEGLLLSRSRILHDLETARNPRYRKILQDTLHHLDRELARLAENG